MAKQKTPFEVIMGYILFALCKRILTLEDEVKELREERASWLVGHNTPMNYAIAKKQEALELRAKLSEIEGEAFKYQRVGEALRKIQFILRGKHYA